MLRYLATASSTVLSATFAISLLAGPAAATTCDDEPFARQGLSGVLVIEFGPSRWAACTAVATACVDLHSPPYTLPEIAVIHPNGRCPGS